MTCSPIRWMAQREEPGKQGLERRRVGDKATPSLCDGGERGHRDLRPLSCDQAAAAPMNGAVQGVDRTAVIIQNRNDPLRNLRGIAA